MQVDPDSIESIQDFSDDDEPQPDDHTELTATETHKTFHDHVDGTISYDYCYHPFLRDPKGYLPFNTRVRRRVDASGKDDYVYCLDGVITWTRHPQKVSQRVGEQGVKRPPPPPPFPRLSSPL